MAKTALDPVSPPNTGARQYHDLLPVSAQRRRRRRPQSSLISGPSSGVLSLLATISATSSTADGRPLVAQPTPPPYLCPSLACSNFEHGIGLLPDAVAETSASALSAPKSTTHPGKRRVVADKFVEGPDGLWRRVDRYTLYGSTVCLDCDPTVTPAADEAIQPSTIASTLPAGTPPPIQPTNEFEATMPDGWDRRTQINPSRVTLILAISLVLAFFICVLMAGCIIWRRKKKRRREHNEELRLRKRREDDVSEHQDLVAKEARVMQKFWARASARWKANIRSSARRRRNRRLVAGVQILSNASSTVSLHDIPSVSRPTSRSPSRRPSTISTLDPRRSISSDRPAAQSAGQANSVLSPIDLETSSPPAYIYSQLPIPIPTPSNQIDNIPPEPLSQCTNHDDEDHPEYTLSPSDGPMPYDDPYHAGHIATDDKTLLARMTHMASAPPPGADEGESPALVTSAPVWHDEELERAIDDSQDHDQLGSPSAPLERPSPAISSFPAPPSKDKMAAPNFYDYPYLFEEDVASLQPEAEPSAPPFEEHPSAPPLEDAELVPSAPPLLEEPLPSAPDWDWVDGERNCQALDLEEDVTQQQPSFSTSSDAAAVPGHLPSYRS